MPFDQGYSPPIAPEANQPFGQLNTAEMPTSNPLDLLRMLLSSKTEQGGSPTTNKSQGEKQQTVDGGVFKLLNPETNPSMSALSFERTSGTPGSLDGVQDAATQMSRFFTDQQKELGIPDSIGVGLGRSRDEILEVLYAQVAQERKQAKFDKIEDKARRARHGL